MLTGWRELRELLANIEEGLETILKPVAPKKKVQKKKKVGRKR